MTALNLEYIKNIDIDQDLKGIYDDLYRICIRNFQDDTKYRIVKKIIAIIPKLSASDLNLIKDIEDNGFSDEKYNGKYDNLIMIGLLKYSIDTAGIEQKFKSINKSMEKHVNAIKKVYEKVRDLSDASSHSRASRRFSCVRHGAHLGGVSPL